MSTIPRPGIFARLWTSYTSSLQRNPLRTKMVQSGVLFISADAVAQMGIEGRRFGGWVNGEEGEDVWDPMRTARLSLYGTAVFAPLAHFWLGGLERIRHASKIATLANKLVLDIFIWSPFVTFMFPTTLGLLEGRSVDEVQKKVALGWFPTWQKAVCVFGPTQVLNFTFIPPQHRLATVQSVGLCWNIFLSWQNNKNNKALAEASARLVEAQVHNVLDHGVDTEEEVEKAQEDVREAVERKDRMKKEGGELGVGVRMGWS
ncbi:hypothetical protein IAR55_003997 [Kwoniella newhampshirensis]|uniref:Protein SYM1 n=1 Tax=Kwoniella newhampshirensis TaxID=1651941 RepID=A0AAW0YMA6_9TREE